MLKIKAERIGLHTPTRVVCNCKVLETQGLDLKTLCDLWKWYFKIPPFEKVELECETRIYRSLWQNPLGSFKSMIDLFAEQGINAVEIKADMVEVCDD